MLFSSLDNYHGLWVNLHFFMMCIYKYCFPPMLFVLAMKCYTEMPCPLPHNHYCCLFPSPIYLPHMLICTCLTCSSSLHPVLANHHLHYVDVYCVFLFFYLQSCSLFMGWLSEFIVFGSVVMVLKMLRSMTVTFAENKHQLSIMDWALPLVLPN